MRNYNQKNKLSRINAYLSAAALMISVLTGCSYSQTEPAQTSSETVSSSYSESETTLSAEEYAPEKETESTAQTSISTETVTVTEETSDTLSEASEPDISQTASEEIVSEETSFSETQTESSASSAAISSSEASSSSAAAFVTTAPPAEIIIPEVKKTTSPGTAVFRSEGAAVDYSNASEGYISVTYTGSSSKAKLRLILGDSKYDHDLAADGTTEYFPLSMGSGKYEIQVFEQVDGKIYSGVLDETLSVKISDETDMYLYPNKYVSFTRKSQCVKKAAEVCAGKSTALEKIAAIFVYVSDNVSYDKKFAETVQSGYIPDPDEVLSAKTGICFDYASLFAAMARSQGIPTRLVIGYASPDIYHAWNEVYTEETGWITVEVFLKKSGFNLLDPTFYSSAGNKQKAADYMDNSGNYSKLYTY